MPPALFRCINATFVTRSDRDLVGSRQSIQLRLAENQIHPYLNAGIAYLLWLGVQAFRSAIAGRYPPFDGAEGRGSGSVLAGFRQGFLSNITNPKVLVFYLAVLPQFLGTSPAAGTVVVYAVTVPAIGVAYLLAVVVGVDRARAVFSRSRVRAAMDAVTGTALVAFSLRLATE